MATKQANNITKVCGRNLEELRVLGSGGQGSVSLCKDRASGKLFALKSAAMTDLSHEFRVVSYLMDHGVQEGIAFVHAMDMVESGPRLGKTCLLMDLCKGGDLLSELKRQPGCRLRESRAATVVRSVAQTLSRCHELGIIHRDVKPENILLRATPVGSRKRKKATAEEAWLNTGDILLADFGLARKFTHGRLIRDGSVAGTKQYMAPEMVLDGAYDERVDVWSLGMLLHVLLIGGFPPYMRHARRLHHDAAAAKEEEDSDTWGLVKRTMELCPNEFNFGAAPVYSELSDGARSLLSGMLQKDPHRRFTLSQVLLHPWLHTMPHVNVCDISTDTKTSPAIKRIRFIMRACPDVVRELHPVPAGLLI